MLDANVRLSRHVYRPVRTRYNVTSTILRFKQREDIAGGFLPLLAFQP